MINVVVGFGHDCRVHKPINLQEVITMDKKKEAKIKKLAQEASDNVDAYVKESGRIGVGLVYAVLLTVSEKLCDIFNPEDVIVAFEKLTEQLRGLSDAMDKMMDEAD